MNAQNQINSPAGFSYDAAGNLIGQSGDSYQFDAENRLTNYNNGAGVYSYNADGERVEKQAGGATTQYIWFGGQVIAELDASGNWTDYIYGNGQRLAMVRGTQDVAIGNASFEQGTTDWTA